MKKFIAVIALASSMGVAYANEPVALTDSQMDNVSAGGYAFSFAGAQALGVVSSATFTSTQTQVNVLSITPIQNGFVTVDQAQSWSTSSASAL
jgi:hypothetical protein